MRLASSLRRTVSQSPDWVHGQFDAYCFPQPAAAICYFPILLMHPVQNTLEFNDYQRRQEISPPTSDMVPHPGERFQGNLRHLCASRCPTKLYVQNPANSPIERFLLGAGDDLVLEVLAEIDEIVAVAGDANDQVLVLLGFGLGLAQGLGVDHVEPS